MIFVNCIVKENNPIQTVLDTSANVNCISKKSVDSMKIVYEKDDSNFKVNGSYFTLGRVSLCITFNNDEKHKSIPSEFIVIGSDWPNHFPDLMLGNLWLKKNGAN